ncbi:hypothetical protein MLD38_021153 [Melastoma candidum]|uniref:Uncharacterized protein n=1 Tax=Melastoma candidum TaxID=119954 RepID=A0ACB9QNA3_9MYRT|nr:hypothetical protein MLD38_021153 [Melastoma candidum]
MRWCLKMILGALALLLSSGTVLSRREPFGMRISCGSWLDVRTTPTNTLWYKDFAYTGGIPTNATSTSSISPPLKTLRYFPLSGGPESCYNINRVPKGRYSVRVFFGLVANPNYDSEPLFDVSIEGTQVHSLRPGWTTLMEQAFAEGILFLKDGSASICFHSTGHGDPAVLSIEILQVDDNAYYLRSDSSNGLIFRTVTRLNCGRGKPKFDEDFIGSHWGGDRFWNPVLTFVHGSDKQVSTEESIKQASVSPNFYPVALYQSALVGTDKLPELEYIMDVDPNRNYSIWLHFAEIDPSIRGVGQRVFDISINGNIEFKGVDIVKMSGDREAALVLNTTVTIDGRTLTISLIPRVGHHALINAIEVFEIITAEAKTLVDEVRALQKLKKSLALPQRLGWNGDPCIPQQHPWVGADCQFDPVKSKWVIDGISLDNQGLRGSLPKEISKLSHLQTLNLSGNSIQGHIPSSLGSISSLQILDLSYNFFNGSIPESLGQLTSLRRLNLNGNSLSGKVPAELGGRLLHRASFNFTDNAGLCGIPGLRKCGPNLIASSKIGIAIGALVVFLLLTLCLVICWKRQKNILRAQAISAREAPYAKARTQFARDLQMSRHGSTQGHARIASENGPSLLS